MEWRIRENSCGGFVAEKGIEVKGGALAPSGIGCAMPAFIVYESAKFETMKQAKRYMEREQRKEKHLFA